MAIRKHDDASPQPRHWLEPARREGWVYRSGLLSATLTILALDYAALDDLLTASDGIYPELFFVIGSIPLLLFLARNLWPGRGK